MKWLYTLLVVLVVFVGAGCQSGASEAGAATRDQSGSTSSSKREIEPIPVETMQVSTTEFRQTSTVPGTTSAIDEVDVSVQQPGTIETMYVEAGERVRTGQRILRLDTDLERARLERLNNAVESAQREFERTQRLKDDGLATPQELDRARTELRDAKLQLKQAELTLERATLRSPTSGVVLRRRVDSGEHASPGRPVVTIADLSTLEIAAAVPASRIGAIEEGDTLDVEIPPIGETVEGTVVRRPERVDPETRTYPVEIHVDNANGAIRPGMRASLTFTLEVWEEAVVIPRAAILQGYTRKEIAVVSGDDSKTGQAQIRGIELGPSAGNRVVVTKGLEAGEQLVVRGHRSLMPDAPARIVSTYESLQEALDSGL
jgi:membrane fusion protein (multidrug efflux system)